MIDEQCIQGANISEERSKEGLEDDLHKIIEVCDTCFQEGCTETEVRKYFNNDKYFSFV
mgnify:CR=1 FL=1